MGRYFFKSALLSPLVLGSVMGAGTLLPDPASAQPYAIPTRPGPFVIPGPCPGICLDLPLPYVVPGKEVSVGNVPANELDRDEFFANKPGQAVFFDGVAALPQSGLRNSHLYNPPNVPPGAIEVDALGHIADIYYREVVEDRVRLLFSVENDKHGQSIFAETPQIAHVDLWARSEGVFGDEVKAYGPLVVGGNLAQILDPTPAYPITANNNLVDLDSLEVWGPDPWPPRYGYNYGPNDIAYDANCWSPVGDTWMGKSASVICHPIENFDPADADSIVYSQADIAAAIGVSASNAPLIDVDAFMTNIPEIMFSIRPIPGLFDGAEIWVWDGVGPADFLVHGGHVWDTAFDLRRYLIDEGFDDMGIAGMPGDINLDALETVPGPLPIVGAGAAFGFSRKLRSRIKGSRIA